MPRVTIEYTNNLIEHQAFKPAELITAINQALMDSKQFGDGDIKTIAYGSDLFARGTQPQGCAFICVTTNILSGRSTEIKRQITDSILHVLKTHVKAVAGLETQLSASTQDMDRDTFAKLLIGKA